MKDRHDQQGNAPPKFQHSRSVESDFDREEIVDEHPNDGEPSLEAKPENEGEDAETMEGLNIDEENWEEGEKRTKQ